MNYFDLWNFPNCIGAIDGKHVPLFSPAGSGSLFYNYHICFNITWKFSTSKLCFILKFNNLSSDDLIKFK